MSAYPQTRLRRLRDCNIEELAVDQMTRAPSGGVSFARKEDHTEKDAARQAILDLFTPEAFPGPLSMLTMPGLRWSFESQLIKQRAGKTNGTYLHCIESDRPIYHAAVMQLPRVQPGGVTMIKGRRCGSFAEQAVVCQAIALFLGDVNALMSSGEEQYIAAWLDYTGPLSAKQLRIIAKFFESSIRDVIIITALGARWNLETVAAIKRAGGHAKWILRALPGSVIHEIAYQDGPSPMLQIAIAKAEGKS